MGGGGGLLSAMQLFHRFISSNWMMEHAFGEEQREEPKGRKKNVKGEKSCQDSCSSKLSAFSVSQMLTTTAPALSGSPWRAAA